jgi:glycerate kinase
MVQRLDDGLRHVSLRFAHAASQLPGAGAAGGLGYGVVVFLDGSLAPGVDLLLEQAGFDRLLEGAALVVTGEGCMDLQTLHGKAPMGVLRRAAARGVPVVGLCGYLHEDAAEALTAAGFCGLYPATKTPQPLAELRQTCRADLYRAALRAAEWARGAINSTTA